MAENQYLVTTSPHIKSEEDVSTVMGTVAIALAPAFIFALYRFGYYALVVTGLAVLSAVVCEAICQRLRGQPVTVNDWSAVVTGLLLAAVIPPNVSWFVPVIGSVVAIGITKHCFGGLGSNIWNPALMGRAFLQAAFPTQINSGVWPAVSSDSMGDTVSTSIHGSFAELVTQSQQSGSDIITSATPLEELARVTATHLPDAQSAATYTVATALDGAANGVWVEAGEIHVHSQMLLDLFLGNTYGCIAEISGLALILGGLYMLLRKVITWHIPVAYIGTAALLGWMLPAPYAMVGGGMAYTGWFCGPWLLHIVGGGLLIGAIFMATDMVTSPLTRKGQVIFGMGCGLLTIVIRLYGGYPEGVCYSILLMNTVVPLIDAWTRPRVFGTGKAGAGGAA